MSPPRPPATRHARHHGGGAPPLCQWGVCALVPKQLPQTPALPLRRRSLFLRQLCTDTDEARPRARVRAVESWPAALDARTGAACYPRTADEGPVGHLLRTHCSSVGRDARGVVATVLNEGRRSATHPLFLHYPAAATRSKRGCRDSQPVWLWICGWVALACRLQPLTCACAEKAGQRLPPGFPLASGLWTTDALGLRRRTWAAHNGRGCHTAGQFAQCIGGGGAEAFSRPEDPRSALSRQPSFFSWQLVESSDMGGYVAEPLGR